MVACGARLQLLVRRYCVRTSAKNKLQMLMLYTE